MDNSLVLEKLKEYWLPVILGLIGIVFLVYGLVSLYSPKKDKPDILFEAASDASKSSAQANSTSQKTITVDVEGGVLKPGVYDLPVDSRIQDALIAAGGMSSTADRAVVSKSLNLAVKLVDGAKIYIPVEGDPALVAGSVDSSGQPVLGSGVININAASAKDLDSLPGIGEVTAEKIIGSRPYGSVDELLTKKIVGQKVFDQIKDKISIY